MSNNISLEEYLPVNHARVCFKAFLLSSIKGFTPNNNSSFTNNSLNSIYCVKVSNWHYANSP